ncbi:uncharacterized protein LOC144336031 [Macaca mulatta]
MTHPDCSQPQQLGTLCLAQSKGSCIHSTPPPSGLLCAGQDLGLSLCSFTLASEEYASGISSWWDSGPAFWRENHWNDTTDFLVQLLSVGRSTVAVRPIMDEKPKGQKGDAMAIAAAEQGLNPKADDFDFGAPAFVSLEFLSSQAR